MKAYKTMLSVVLAIMMLVTMIVPTWAASGTNSNDGKITIDNAVVGETYNVYQLLVLESFNNGDGSNAYAYKVADAWKSFFAKNVSIKMDEETTVTVDILDNYVSIDEDGYVTWKMKDTSGKDTGADEFAKYAAAYAKANSIAATKSTTATTNTVVFDKLNLGYYLVTTTLGSLCSLDTTAKEVTIKEKNEEPTLDKQVKEDSTGNWGYDNDADIGQTVEFKAIITTKQNTIKEYVLHDTMSTGLTFVSVTKVELTKNGETTPSTVDSTNYTVTSSGFTDGCTFEVKFNEVFCKALKNGDVLVVYYNATVNDGAVVGLDGDDNKAKLEYTDDYKTGETPEEHTKTYTWDMDVFKYTKNSSDEKVPLQGVEFVLVKKKTVENTDRSESLVDDKVATVDANGKLTNWVDLPTQDGTWPTNSVLTTNAQGKIEIDGLDADTYYLREIEALPGFNILSEDKEVVITGATEDGETGKLTYTTVTVEVENKSGTELPSTGGIGTTIFYCAGAILALGAFVLLVTKKRMGRE